jgi:PhnB protein
MQAIPDAYRVATPYLIVKGGNDAIAFYKKALGATEVVRLADPSGKVMHAELLINHSRFMLADEFPDMGYRSPQFDGDRRGTVTDPFGHVWLLASRKEEISKEEMQRRFDAMLKQVS